MKKNKNLNFKEYLEKRGAKLDEKQTEFVGAFEDAMQEHLIEQERSFGEAIEDKIKTLNIPEDIAEQLRGFGEKIQGFEEKKIKLSDSQKTQLRHFVKENSKEILDSMKQRRNFGTPEDGIFQIRAAAPHLNSNGTVTLGSGVSAPTIENVDPNVAIAQIRYPENFILNLISNQQVSKVFATSYEIEQASQEGDAAIVAEAATKPLIQYKWVKNAVSRKKYAGHIEWSEEFEMDNDALFAAILRMIENTVVRAWNNGMYADIIANALPYTSSAFDATVYAPNATDVANVLASLIGANNYTANTVVLNPATLTSLLLIKKTDGEYIVNPAFDIKSGTLSGMKVLASNVVAAGKMLVLDSAIYTETHTDIITRVGQHSTQLLTNEYSLIAELYSKLKVAKIDLVASYYVTLSTVETALTHA